VCEHSCAPRPCHLLWPPRGGMGHGLVLQPGARLLGGLPLHHPSHARLGRAPPAVPAVPLPQPRECDLGHCFLLLQSSHHLPLSRRAITSLLLTLLSCVLLPAVLLVWLWILLRVHRHHGEPLQVSNLLLALWCSFFYYCSHQLLTQFQRSFPPAGSCKQPQTE
jgi:hypothetical protein